MKLKRGDIKMKIKEQVLSIEQMKHLQELGVDTSDASMCWLRYDVGGVVKQYVEINDVKWHEWSRSTPCPTYTIGDLIEKIPKHFYVKEAPISMVALNGSGAFDVKYLKISKSCKSDGTIKNALYKLLCWIAENHKELL